MYIYKACSFYSVKGIQTPFFNPYHAEYIYSNFHPPEVVYRYRDPQPQVVENYSFLCNLSPNINKSRCLNSHFIPNNSDLVG